MEGRFVVDIYMLVFNGLEIVHNLYRDLMHCNNGNAYNIN